ncbi:unnamed protein product [Alopecurus aequalis]
MDRFCDNIVEEILRRLPAKCLHRVRAAARCYNHIILSPEFVARYWGSHAPYLSGVFLQSNRPWWQHSRFLGGGPSAATESILSADLAFLPSLPPGPAARNREIFIVHATAGLLLCSRGEYRPTQYYVCNPVTWQCVALPELPWRPTYMSGLLSLTDEADGSSNKFFQVVLFDHPSSWNQNGGCMDLKVYSSATGRWEAKCLRIGTSINVVTHAPSSLGQSGTAYWIGYQPMDKLIAYNSLHHTIHVLPLPGSVHDTTALNRCIGELHCGILRYAHVDCSVLQVWDLQTGGGVDGVWWKMVHQVDVMELAARNPEAVALVTSKPEHLEHRINDSNPLFTVLGFHPTVDIIFLDLNHNVGAYSIEHGTITYQCSHQYFCHNVFPYVHPAHPVEIPTYKGITELLN